MDKPVTPRGVNHLVLNVRDIEESHRFWTEVVGFHQVGQLTPTKDRPNPPKMRFYSGVREDGTSHHHDVALVENRDLPPPPKDWAMFGMPVAVNHIAITMPRPLASSASAFGFMTLVAGFRLMQRCS